MDYASTILFQSRLFPNVQFRVFKPNTARRAWLTLTTKESVTRITALVAQAKQHAENMDDPQQRTQLFKLGDILTAEVSGVQVEIVRWGLAEVLGLKLDGAVPSTEEFVRHAPTPLFQEIVETIQRVIAAPDESLAPQPQQQQTVSVQ